MNQNSESQREVDTSNQMALDRVNEIARTEEARVFTINSPEYWANKRVVIVLRYAAELLEARLGNRAHKTPKGR